jgi:tRNA threonylcarbamoyladenosine modification (KEOPS) complex Cgi121 subunit
MSAMISGEVDSTPYAFGTVRLPPGWVFPDSALPVQLVQPESVYGPRQLVSSVHQTLKAFAQKANTSPNKGMELLLRIAGTRQIKEALKLKPTGTAVLVVFGKGASKEFARLVKDNGWKDAGDVASREGELDAIERSLLL